MQLLHLLNKEFFRQYAQKQSNIVNNITILCNLHKNKFRHFAQRTFVRLHYATKLHYATSAAINFANLILGCGRIIFVQFAQKLVNV